MNQYSTELIPAWYKLGVVGCAECKESEQPGFFRKRQDGVLSSVPCACLKQHEKDKITGSLLGQTLFTQEMWSEATKENCIKNIKVFDSVFSAETQAFLKSGDSVYFYGQMNTGKTLMAMFICRKFIEAGVPVLFYPVGELLREFKNFNSTTYHETFDRVMNIEVLCLDDLGTQTATDFNDSSLFDLINGRYMRGLQTIITGNARPYSGEGSSVMERVFSKITRKYKLVKF